jgi:DNA-binding IclR family transcriptional regulator
MKAKATTKPASANTTAERAIDVLLLFSEERPLWSASDIAARLDMPRSTTYRYLGTLKGYSLIAEDERGGYRLGPRVFSLARVARSGVSVIKVAAPHMTALRDRFDETVILYERAERDLVSVERAESRQGVSISFTRSQFLPWPANSSSKLLLALSDAGWRSEMLAMMRPTRYAPKTIPDRKALTAELERIRQAGYAIADEERNEGVWGVSAPITYGAEVRYCLSVAAPKFRLAGRQKTIVAAVRETADRISGAMNEFS